MVDTQAQASGGLYARLLDSDAGMGQLSPAQRQALERLQAAQAAAIAALNAPAEDPVTHYLKQSTSRSAPSFLYLSLSVAVSASVSVSLSDCVCASVFAAVAAASICLCLCPRVRLCLCSRELAIARHELRALRELRVEMDPQVAGDGGTAPVDPRAEVARLEQVRPPPLSSHTHTHTHTHTHCLCA